jgi:hypothetical protein
MTKIRHTIRKTNTETEIFDDGKTPAKEKPKKESLKFGTIDTGIDIKKFQNPSANKKS